MLCNKVSNVFLLYLFMKGKDVAHLEYPIISHIQLNIIVIWIWIQMSIYTSKRMHLSLNMLVYCKQQYLCKYLSKNEKHLATTWCGSSTNINQHRNNNSEKLPKALLAPQIIPLCSWSRRLNSSLHPGRISNNFFFRK